VNREDLNAHTAPIEAPLWEAEMRARGLELRHASDYFGLNRYQLFAPPSRHFRGDPGSNWGNSPENHSVVAMCQCGVSGCWDLMCRIQVSPERVTWAEFHQPNRRDWQYPPEFSFDRRQYDAALAALDKAVAIAEPPR
jgi:hypothetical protein